MINEEFDFWGVKGAVLGVAKVNTTSEHVPKHHSRLFLPKKNICTLFVRGDVTFYSLHQFRWTKVSVDCTLDCCRNCTGVLCT